MEVVAAVDGIAEKGPHRSAIVDNRAGNSPTVSFGFLPPSFVHSLFLSLSLFGPGLLLSIHTRERVQDAKHKSWMFSSPAAPK